MAQTKLKPDITLIQMLLTLGRAGTQNLVSKTIKDDYDAGRSYRIHAGYAYPELFVWFYIREESYRIAEMADVHHAMLNAIMPGDYGKQINIQAPRGIGKTTIVNRLIPIWRICYKEIDIAMNRQPEEFILIVGRNETMARQRMTEIRQVLERNPVIRSAIPGRNVKPIPATASPSVRSAEVHRLEAR